MDIFVDDIRSFIWATFVIVKSAKEVGVDFELQEHFTWINDGKKDAEINFKIQIKGE